MKNIYPTKFKFKLESDHIPFDDNGYDIFNMNGFYNAVAQEKVPGSKLNPRQYIRMIFLKN